MTHALSVTTAEHGPVTIPIHSIRLIKTSPKGEAVIVFNDGEEVTTDVLYKYVSVLLISTEVWGTVSAEHLN